MSARVRPSQIPLRQRLTLWYTLSMGLILLLFAAFLYVQVRRSLIDQVDAALRLAAAQALISLDEEGGRLAFQAERNPEAMQRLNDDFVIYLRDPGGAVLSRLSNDDNLPLFPPEMGANTKEIEGETWRVYGQAVSAGDQNGLLQVGQELDPVVATLASLQAQLLLGLSLALLLAGLGGFFLAGRALRPINRITQIAQAISASDLGQRIHYQGPADEVGRLAQTFDTMLDRLQAAFDRERRFTGDAAHELRTPLTALKGRIGVTLSRPRQPAAYEETLQEMEDQVDRLIRLSNDLLFMARLDQGQFRPLTEQLQLTDLIGAVLDQVQPSAETKGITLVENIPQGLTIQGDLNLLLRLFLNLLDNAVKYTPENGRVTVQGRQQTGKTQVAISDTGPGIAAEHLAHLFDRFYRAEEDRARTGAAGGQSGAGLGLAIAYEIARAHGGTLTATSEAGMGTIFMVQLP
ncbi:MAG: HAMP domain-containing protein [Chloroflexota bacterium]|nr:MAG: HAMP domain-containing protein [Chloroflexota bacterium]